MLSATYKLCLRHASVVQAEDIAKNSTPYPLPGTRSSVLLLRPTRTLSLAAPDWQVTHRLLPSIENISFQMCGLSLSVFLCQTCMQTEQPPRGAASYMLLTCGRGRGLRNSGRGRAESWVLRGMCAGVFKQGQPFRNSPDTLRLRSRRAAREQLRLPVLCSWRGASVGLRKDDVDLQTKGAKSRNDARAASAGICPNSEGPYVASAQHHRQLPRKASTRVICFLPAPPRGATLRSLRPRA